MKKCTICGVTATVHTVVKHVGRIPLCKTHADYQHRPVGCIVCSAGGFEHLHRPGGKMHEIAESQAAEAGRYDALGDVILAEQAWRIVETAVGYPVLAYYRAVRRAAERREEGR